MPLLPLKYWARATAKAATNEGDSFDLCAWAGSALNTDDATVKAQSRLAQWQQTLSQSRDAFYDQHDYGYSKGPQREELLTAGPWLDDANHELGCRWLVTRARYGAEILNAAQLAMLDLDMRGLGLGWWWKSLFRSAAERQRLRLDALRQWIDNHPSWGARVYSTAAGFRVLITHHPFQVRDAAIQDLMRLTQTDRLYQRLCLFQECFRARLTPKPWRLMPMLDRVQWRPLAEGETRTREDVQWLADYKKASDRHSVCHLLFQWGNPCIHEDLVDLVTFHDQCCHVTLNQPLA